MSEADQPRIGARVVVELLRLKADKPPSNRLVLTDARSKHALAVLRDRLQTLQQNLPFPAAVPKVSEALEQACADLQIPLPIAQPDWGGIRLLDQLFDQWLQYRPLDDEAQQWLAFLRLPVIRYAILDYSFFFTPQNLMRRFLNQLHLVLLSSSEKSRQVLRQSLQPFLQRIHSEFQKDIGACNRICIEAQTWFASHSDRVEQIEEQLRIQEISQRKEKVAEPRVARELNRIAAGKPLPRMLIDFLHGEWQRSLLMISMREGEDGATWKRQIRITESLVELALACQEQSGRDQYRSFYPVLMKNIRTLLVSVNQDAAALEQALDPLELIVSALLNGAQVDTEPAPELVSANGHITVAIKQVGARALARIQALQAGDWVRIQIADGSHDVFRITLTAQGDEPWVLVSQSGKTITRKTAFQLAQGLEGGVLEIIGLGRWWDEQLDRQLNELHGRWQEELARRPPPPPLAERPTGVETAAAMELTLAPQTPESAQAQEALAPSRTDEILANSQLSLAPVDEPEAVPAPASEPLPPADDDREDFLKPHAISPEELEAALQAVDQLQVGGWIVQQTTKGEERCKLAVRLRGRDKLIFVNRLGVKALEIDRQPLAELLARGLVTIIDTGEKFDNTLERVVRSIQQDRKIH